MLEMSFVTFLTDIKYIFLVGGFAESPVLQQELRQEFGHLLKIIIPQDVGLTILKGNAFLSSAKYPGRTFLSLPVSLSWQLGAISVRCLLCYRSCVFRFGSHSGSRAQVSTDVRCGCSQQVHQGKAELSMLLHHICSSWCQSLVPLTSCLCIQGKDSRMSCLNCVLVSFAG